MPVFSVFIIGFAALSSQITILRELLIILYGNEITIGIIIGIWLLCGSIGGFLASRTLLKIKNDRKTIFALLQGAAGLYLPASILLIRIIPRLLDSFPGQIIPQTQIFAISLIVIFPLNTLLGALFAYGCEIQKRNTVTLNIGYTYISESAGAFAGGIFTTFLLLAHCDSLQIHLILSIAMFVCAGLLNFKKSFAILMFIFSVLCILLFPAAPAINKELINKTYPGFEAVFLGNTHYQNLLVLRRHNTYSLYTNGIYAFTVPDTQNSELTAHIPLTQHPDPKNILVIGAGLSGILDEILKYPVETVTYLEIDDIFINKMAKIFPLPQDKRLNIATADPKRWFEQNNKKFDLILQNLPPPHTLLLNRYYTREFFTEVKKNLNTGGILAFSLPSQPNYLSVEQRMLFISMKKTLESIFKYVLITPGNTSFFISSDDKSPLTRDYKTILSRMHYKKITTEYFTQYYLFSEFSDLRFQQMDMQLKDTSDIPINSDLKPVAFYLNTVLWMTRQKKGMQEFFKLMNKKTVLLFLISALSLFLLSGFLSISSINYRILALFIMTFFS
ncbi:spermidine synthase [Elusimicrobiota bacterium]